MADSQSPHIAVPVDKLVVKPGESVTLLVTNHVGEKTEVVVRSVGATGARIGHPQIFYGNEVFSIEPLDQWRSMYDAASSVYGSVRLAEPKPPNGKEGGVNGRTDE
jgi:hypothetical protein